MEIQNQTNTSETQAQPLDTVEQDVTNNTENAKSITTVDELSDQTISESTSSDNDIGMIHDHSATGDSSTIISPNIKETLLATKHYPRVLTTSDLSASHYPGVDPVTERRKENNKKPKAKKEPPKAKPVDLSRLANLKDVIAKNYMNHGNSKKPSNFGKFVPKDIKVVTSVTINELDDGKTHINISFNGKTKLGQALDFYYFSPINIPDLGSFNCIGGLQHFLMSSPYDERLRTAAGRTCRELGKSIQAKPIPGLKNIIAEATWYKVCQNEALMNMVLESDLPFHAYYVKENNIVFTGLNIWYTKVLEEIRKTIKLNDNNLKQYIKDGKDVKTLEILYPNFEFLEKQKSNKNN